MHSLMLVMGIALACGVRWGWRGGQGNLSQRWSHTLTLFLFPPLFLVMTAIAVLCMGPSGQMLGHWEGGFSYDLALGFVLWAIATGGSLAWQAYQSVQRIQACPQIEVQGQKVRLLDTSLPYSAQIGWWRSQLVVSRGLLTHLDAEHLTAVLTHEHAHAHYRDPFWFFALGWLRRVTAWLPGTETLWQDLLMLRELRADRYAAQFVDPLVLAESLLTVVSVAAGHSQPLAAEVSQPETCAAFGWVGACDRLTERIDAILETPPTVNPQPFSSLLWLVGILLPFILVPLHVR